MKHRNNLENEKNQYEFIEDLLISYLTGSASEEERKKAVEWINKNQKNKIYFDELKDYYQLTKVIQHPSGFNKEEGWNRVKAKYYKAKFEADQEMKNKNRIRSIIRISASIAASIIIAFFTGVYTNKMYNLKLPEPTVAINEITVPHGSKSQLTLPDGSKVWLNAGSKLSYHSNFNKDNRNIMLEGEAYFDVKKSRKHLFIVKTSNLDIKVYGTRFNVKSYPDEEQIQTTLVEGSLAIETHNKSEAKNMIFLKPNQTATYYKNTFTLKTNVKDKIQPANSNVKVSKSILINKKIDPVPITSWKDNKWIFKAEELENIAKRLERRYNVRIIFENESLKKYKFSGTLMEETFEQVLKVIQLSAPVIYNIEKNMVYLKEDPHYKKKYDKMITN